MNGVRQVMKRTVFFVSDSTGVTAETLGHALMTQFVDSSYQQVTLPFITDIAMASATVEQINQAGEADGCRPIVFSSLTDSSIYEAVLASEALVLDLFSAFVRPLEEELKAHSLHVTGRSHGMSNQDNYEVRINAVDFALNHDDGASTRHYADADIILIGVSRSGKTPTSVYLAMQYGIRAANYPLTEEDLDAPVLPDALLPFTGRLFALTIDPERLQQIRRERRPNSRYASASQCRMEVASAEALFQRTNLDSINTSNVSIEEISSRILLRTGLKRRLF